MLEVKWKVVYLELIYKSMRGFNPCYVGSKMERMLCAFSMKKRICFNPCYVGSKMERVSVESGDIFLVQVSILVMLEVKWKEMLCAFSMKKRICFNPCYVGSKMERITNIPHTGIYFSFQSLLCWK